MIWRLALRNFVLHFLTAAILAAVCLLVSWPIAAAHPRAALLGGVLFMGVITAFAYEPLRRLIQGPLDRYFFANRFSYLEVLGRLPNDLLEFTNLREMLDHLVTRLTQSARLKRVRIFMHDPGHQSYVEMVFRGPARAKDEFLERPAKVLEGTPLIQWLTEDSRLWTLDDLKRLSEPNAKSAWTDLKDLGGDACFPINKDKELLGLVVLGPKLSGEPFNAHDLKVLRALRRQLENFLTQAMVLTQEALNMVKDAHDMKNDVNALKGRVSWRAMRLESWWMDFEQEMDPLGKGTSDPVALAALASVKKRANEFYSDTKRALPIEENAITRLSHHLKNWAEFGRVVAEGFRGRRSMAAVNVGQTASVSVDRWRPMAEKKNLELSAEIEGPLFIWGERSLLEQIIENLIDNAVKATVSGYVRVICRPSGSDVQIDVKDTGCGIAAEQLPAIFEKPFYHKRDAAKLDQGTGVGLYLVAQYVRSLGGRVTVESAVGKGSTFHVVLPAHKEPSAAEVAA